MKIPLSTSVFRTRRAAVLACVGAAALATQALAAPAAQATTEPAGAAALSPAATSSSASQQSSGNTPLTLPGLLKKEKQADPNADGYDRFIVTYKSSVRAPGKKSERLQALDKAAEESHVDAQEMRETATGSHVVSLKKGKKLKGQAAKDFMKELQADPDVLAVEPDARAMPTLTPSDPYYSSLWGLNGSYGIKAPGAWDYATGRGTTVAVVDTGITNHPDLNANVLAGYDFITDTWSSRDGNGRDSNPADEGDWTLAGDCGPQPSNSSWHGSHVAGTIAAVANSTGVVGVAPDAKILPVRVLGRCGGYTSDITDAIVWASGGTVSGVPANRTPADVINMSLGGSGQCSSAYQQAINTATQRGTVVVVAAGNESQNAANSVPANCNNVITVGATTIAGRTAFYTNYGATVDISAPGGETSRAGEGILSTINSGKTTPASATYGEYQGTSMATPHVAGIVALMKQRNKSINVNTARQALQQTAAPVTGGCPQGCGSGRVDAAKALAAVAGGPTDPTPTPTPTGNLLANPGFESGNASWTSNKTDTFENNSSQARTGSWSAALNGWGNANQYTLQQNATLPAGKAAKLSFYLKVDTNEKNTSAYDTLAVQVNDGSGFTTLKTLSNQNAGGYALQTVDLSRYAGKTVTVRFVGTEDSAVATLFRLDDVSLTAG